MKAVITGANSFVGISLARKLAASGWETVLVVRPGREMSLPPYGRVVPLRMEEYSQLGKLAGGCDCFVHLAWNGTRGGARMDALMQNENVRCSLQGVSAMLQAGCKRVITAGSQAEYGPHSGQITEESLCKPNTEYGKAKLHFYEKTADLCVQSGVAYKEPRLFSLYGPGDYSGTMIISVLRDMLAHRPCDLTQGVQMWDFLYIDDAVDGLIRLCRDPCPDGAYNFGSGDARPLREFIEEMVRLTQTASVLRYGAVAYPPTGMVSIWPNIQKMKTVFGWQPKISFKTGIESVIGAINTGRK